MRLLHPDGQVVHLAYCTNVHPAEDLHGILAQLDRFAVPVRRALGTDLLGLGLWLAAPVASTLARSPRRVHRLRQALRDRGLEVVTLNGFPYQGFQQAVVEHAAYQPDWTTQERLTYTTDLAAVLAELLPDDAVRGSVSTLPLAWRDPWDDAQQTRAVGNLARLGDALDALDDRTARTIRVGLEPESGCVIETTEQAITRLAEVRHPGIGICLDACHLAVAFEQPQDAVARLRTAGLDIVKAQASTALQVAKPGDPVTQVPLGARPEPPLTSTLDHLSGTLEALFGGAEALTDHVEVETHSWGVLPEHQRPQDDDGALATAIAVELAWLRDALVAQGLKETQG